MTSPRPRTAPNWPGAELVSARPIQRIVPKQGRASALAGVAAVAWRLGPLPAPERLLDYVILGVAVALVIEGLVVAMQRDRGDRTADDLIERGFEAGGRDDPVSVAVQERIRHLSSERNRRTLADALRSQLELEARRAHIRARYQPFPPLRGFTAHAGRIWRIAAAVERAPCDPRVSIRMARLLVAPEHLTADPARLAAVLNGVERLLMGGTTQLRPEWPQKAGVGTGADYPGATKSALHETGRRIHGHRLRDHRRGPAPPR
jgi:hypothetical protein